MGIDPEKPKSRCIRVALGSFNTMGIHTGACSKADRCYSVVLEASSSSIGDHFEAAFSILGLQHLAINYRQRD